MISGIKKFSALLVAIMLLAASLPGTAVAEGAAALSIDTSHKYEGMNKTWGQGYLPTVNHGVVKVVLPLILNSQSGVAAVRDNTVVVKPDYGDPSSSPFVFSNVETKVKLGAHGVNGTTATVPSWLLSFSFSLESHRVNGHYPLTFHVSYTLPDGTAATQDFTVYVTIKDGINPYATPKPAATPKPTPKPQPQPKLIVSRYAVAPEVVAAGTEFKLDFDIKNTSTAVDVRNIKVAVKGEGTDLVPVSGSNTLYISSLAKAATATQSFSMKAGFDAEPKPHKVTITIDYEDGDGTAYTASDDMLVQVSQPIRLEFDKPNLAATVNAGDTVPISLNVFNMGRNALQNVMCKVQTPGLLPEGSAFIGSMDAGASKSAEIFVYIGTKDMALSDSGDITTDTTVSELYGATTGFINVSYEDEFGNKYNQQVKLDTTIKEPVAPAATAAPEQTAPEAGQWWVSVVIAGVVIVAIVAVLMLSRRKRAREVTKGDETD